MKKILFIIITVLLFSFDLFASEIQFMTHNSEEQTVIDEKGELRGVRHSGRRAFCVELVREMMTIMKVPRKISQVPLARGMVYIQKQDNYALFNVTQTPDRKDTVKWVGPIETEFAYFYEMKKFPTEVKTLSDAKKVRSIGVVNGGVHESTLKNKGFTNTYPVTSYTQCFVMLKLNRVDLTVSNENSIPERVKKAGISSDEIQRTPVIVMEASGYLAFSKNIPDKIIRQWQNAFNQLKRSGRYKELYDLYYLAKK